GAAVWAFTKTTEGYEPNTPCPLSEEDGEVLSSLLDELDDNDDVQEVYMNAE
ncbi:MAG: YebC/PmpR family DNA-binding transcriptional regulator, partial [Candidatus Yonathbacteria bacterium]|nr:YebC/PmpR family DNA-binding transcriptional regulator [Candidatus Yonathbacteria bacterium]